MTRIHPNFYEFGCSVVNHLKTRYTSAVIKADFNEFVTKAKSPANITVGDAKRVAGTAFGMAGLFYAGEVFGKNSIVGYNPGYDVSVSDAVSAKH
eukprot:gene1086-1233_t